MDKLNNLKGSIMLLIAAIIWGSAFVAQEEAAGYIGSFTINCLRSFVAVIALFPASYIFKRSREKHTKTKQKLYTKKLVISGVLCGIALSVAANLQQFGIIFNAELSEGGSGKAGFITAMYIIFVPIFSCFIGKKLRFSMVLGVIIGVLGLYFISVKDGFNVSAGDIVLLLCAMAFALHIMIVDRVISFADGMALSCIQFLTVGVVSGVLMFIFEHDSLTVYNLTASLVPILFCGVLSSGIAYTLQIIGQKHCEPTVASIVMCLESVFAMVTCCIFYGILPETRETIGCVLMLIAIIVVETPFADNAFSKIFKQKVTQ